MKSTTATFARIAIGVLTLTTAVAASTRNQVRQTDDSQSVISDDASTSPNVIDAIYDGTCFYPKPDVLNFNLTAYLGRWYQVAGTFAPFTAGCDCIFAEYSLRQANSSTNSTSSSTGTNDDDSSNSSDETVVNVFNACQRNGQASNITGSATPVDQVYGSTGVFKVEFPFGSTDDCPGPNYIVQDYSYDGKWALVQASNFSTLFVLSREQNPGSDAIDAWLQRAERRGSNLTSVIRVNQTGCLYT